MTDPSSLIRVAIFQPALPKYRIPVFNGIGAAEDIALTLFPSPKLKDSSLPQAEGAESFEVVEAPMTRSGPFFRQPAQHEALEKDRFDVVVFSWNARNLDLVKGLDRARELGMGSVLWGHGYSKRERFYRRMLRNRLTRRADAMLTYNNIARDRLIKDGIAADRVFVALNAIDQTEVQAARSHWLDRPEELKAFRVEHDLDDRPSIIFVSRLEADNRVDWLIHGFERALHRVPNARLIIVGGGPAREELESIARLKGIVAHVTFTGPIYDELALAPYMMTARAFCYPTNIGLSILHAMGYGLPVVTSDATARQNPEIEAHRPERNGLTWKHAQLDDLADVLVRLMTDDDLRDRLGAEAHRTVMEDFSLDRMIEGYLTCIRAVAARR
jgi:glycosyltransferase involved in cell wall biosynthesis